MQKVKQTRFTNLFKYKIYTRQTKYSHLQLLELTEWTSWQRLIGLEVTHAFLLHGQKSTEITIPLSLQSTNVFLCLRQETDLIKIMDKYLQNLVLLASTKMVRDGCF